MNKSEYISKLAQGLKDYDISNKYDILADYEQIVDEILIDYEYDFNVVIDKLGYPEVLAKDIIQELGYGKSDNSQQTKTKPKTHYNSKRHKSNAIWNLILFFYTIIQIGFGLALSTLIIIGLYFGFGSEMIIQSSVNLNSTQTHIAFCDENENCDGYLFTLSNQNSPFNQNRISITRCDLNAITYLSRFECQFFGDITHQIQFPLGLGLATSIVLIFLIMILLHTLIYSTIKPITIKNNEYNRRRNYE